MVLSGYSGNHPNRRAVGLLLIVIFVIAAFGAIHEVFQLESLIQIASADLILTLIGIFLLTRLGWWGKAGFMTGISRAQIPLFILPAVIALLSLADGIRVTAPVSIIAFAALTILIGFTEETWFRGLIFTTLLPAGTIRAVVISSFLFAAPHLLNALGGIWDPVFTVVDAGAAFGVGITFAALRLRTGSIWPVIGLHALFDFTALVSEGGIEIPAQSPGVLVSSVFIGFVFVVYGLYLMRTEIKSGQSKDTALFFR